MKDIKPTTVFLCVYLSFCFVAVIMSWSALTVVIGQNKRLVSVVAEQQAEVLKLQILVATKNAIIKRTREDTVIDVVLALEYILPGVCANELRRTAHIVKQMKEKKLKEEKKDGKH